jgi:hypothetical protein
MHCVEVTVCELASHQKKEGKDLDQNHFFFSFFLFFFFLFLRYADRKAACRGCFFGLFFPRSKRNGTCTELYLDICVCVCMLYLPSTKSISSSSVRVIYALAESGSRPPIDPSTMLSRESSIPPCVSSPTAPLLPDNHARKAGQKQQNRKWKTGQTTEASWRPQGIREWNSQNSFYASSLHLPRIPVLRRGGQGCFLLAWPPRSTTFLQRNMATWEDNLASTAFHDLGMETSSRYLGIPGSLGSNLHQSHGTGLNMERPRLVFFYLKASGTAHPS